MAFRQGAGIGITAIATATIYRYNQVKAREANLPTSSLSIFDKRHSQTSPGSSRNRLWTRLTNYFRVATSPETSDVPRQRVVVIGAGVVGVSTAYKLAKRGHQVAVLEPMPEPADECSACAAGGMSRQNVVVDKSTWNAVLQCLAPRAIQRLVWGSPDPEDFQFFHIEWFNCLSDPFFLRWAWTFTITSLFPNSEQIEKRNEMLKFTNIAVQDMVSVFENPSEKMAQTAGYNPRGCLAISYEKNSTSDNNDGSNAGLTLEPNRLIQSTKQIFEIEPSLSFQHCQPILAKYEYDVKAASSGRFTKELARRCEEDPALDVRFFYNTKVLGIDTTNFEQEPKSKRRIKALRTNKGFVEIPSDVHVVVAAGAWTPHILSFMDLYAPVYPLKGYALSISAGQALREITSLHEQDLPSRIVCDKFMYTTRLGDEIRITSIGEFSGWDTHPTKVVDQTFRKEAVRQFPQLQKLIESAKTNCGHRPFVSDGVILLGSCSDTYEKLYVSCGPGSNGWKLAFGSGEVVTRLISGHTPEQIQLDLGFDCNAFSPVGRVLHSPAFSKICRARWNV